MIREAPRTVYSLSKKYQKRIRLEDYEIIVIDNNSSELLNKEEIEGIGPNITYYYHESGSASPVSSINFGIGKSKGEYVGILIDGARIVSPMVLNWALYSL
jgi:glycosyltransferase involved in cell wall biosynthesis